MPSTEMLLPKIRPLYFGIADDVVGTAVGNLASGDEHDQALREAHHGAHDVLDENNRNSTLVEPDQQRDDIAHLALREAGHRFVGDQQFWLSGDRARKLELAHLHLREVARTVVRFGFEADEPENLDAVV